MPDLVEAIWAKLTEYNPACSCCSGDSEYISLVNEIGAMIGGREWVRRYDRESQRTIYEVVMTGA